MPIWKMGMITSEKIFLYKQVVPLGLDNSLQGIYDPESIGFLFDINSNAEGKFIRAENCCGAIRIFFKLTPCSGVA